MDLQKTVAFVVFVILIALLFMAGWEAAISAGWLAPQVP